MNRLKVMITVAIAAGTVVVLVLSSGVTAATRAAPTNTSPPTITGTAQEGQKLVGHRGQWTAARPTTTTSGCAVTRTAAAARTSAAPTTGTATC